MSQLGTRLRYAREHLDLTQQEFADRVGLRQKQSTRVLALGVFGLWVLALLSA